MNPILPTTQHTTRPSLIRSITRKSIAALLGGCLLAGLSAQADYDWTGTAGDGWYTNSANWTGTATDNNFVDTGLANYPTVNAAVSWNPNDLKIGGKGGSLSTYTTGRVDVVSGALNVNYWTFIGDWAGEAYLNIANTAAGGGTYTGYGQGTGSFRAGALNGNGNIHIGLYGSTGTLNMNTTGTNTASGLYIAPNNIGGAGTFNLDSGTVNISGDMQVGSDFWGAGTISDGHFNMSGGTVNVGNLFEIGHLGLSATSGTSDATIAGGTLNVENDLKLGFAGNSGTTALMTITGGATVNVASTTTRWVVLGQYDPTDVSMVVSNGGTLNLNAGTDIQFAIGGNTGNRLLNVDGGTINGTAAGGSHINLQNNTAAGTSTMNLKNGGLVAVDGIFGGAVSTLNLDNGKLKATTSSTNFIQGLAAANVLTGGVSIDSNGKTISIAQALLNNSVDQDGGLTKTGNGTLFLNGVNTYTNVTRVGQGSLGGTGTIAGLVVVSNSAGLNLANGTAGGTLTLANGLTLTTANTLAFEVGATPDQIAITGGSYTAPGSAATVLITNLSGLTTGTNKLITGAAGISLGSFTLGTTPPTGYGYALQVTGSDLELVVTAVAPTAAFWKGGVNGLWNAADSGALFNWATNDAGTGSTVSKPATPTAVTFSASGAANQNTTLGENFTISSLTFDASAGNVTVGASGAEGLTVISGITNDSANTQTINVPVTPSGAQSFSANSANLVINSNITKTALLTVAGVSNTVLTGNVTGSGGLTKVGNGTLIMNGYNAGVIQVNAGKVALAGTTTPGADVLVGSGTGVSGTMDINTGGSVSMPSTWFFVGPNNGTGVLNVSGNGSMNVLRLWAGGAAYNDNGTGTINIDTTGTITGTDGIMIGEAWSSGTGSGTVNLTNGTLVSGNEFWVGGDCNTGSVNNGTLNQSGGSVSSAAWLCVGRSGNGGTAIGTYNLSAGTVTAATSTVGSFLTIGSLAGGDGTMNVSGGSVLVASSRRLFVGEGGTGTLNVSGTGLVTCSNAVASDGFQLGGGASAAGTVNLNGGTIRAAYIRKGSGSGTWNFNGGTLQAVAGNTNFMNGLTAANVRTGGATINTAGYDITIGQALVNNGVDEDGGLTKTGNGTLFLNGANSYTNMTTVNGGYLGGSGTIAGAVVVNSGAGLAPGNSIGSLTINGNLALTAGSTNVFEVDGTTPANDQVAAGASVTYGGVLKIVPSGAFTSGQTFTLFSGAGATSASNFSSLEGSPGSGLAFSFTNGVLSVVSSYASNPTNLTFSASGGSISLSWPADHTGWILQTQTNSRSTGLSSNWLDVSGTAGVTATNFPVSQTSETVFFRLRIP